jgi:hypothetical protein
MKKQFLYLLFGFLLAFAACKKEDDTQNAEQPFIGTWQQVSVEESVNGGSWQDVTDSCDQQEMVKIMDNSDHGLRLYSNTPSQCSGQPYEGRWDVFEGGKEMTWNIDGILEPIKKTVVTINENTMVTIHDANTATPMQIRNTYSKQ